MKSLLATPVGKHQEGVNFLDVGRLKKMRRYDEDSGHSSFFKM
jgi:hypothetical protein